MKQVTTGLFLIAFLGTIFSQNLFGGAEIARVASEEIAGSLSRGIEEGIGRQAADAVGRETVEATSKELAGKIGQALEEGLKGIDLSTIAKGDIEKALKGIGADLGDAFKSSGAKGLSADELSSALKASFDKQFKEIGIDVSKTTLETFKTADLEAFKNMQAKIPGTVEGKIPSLDPEKERLTTNYKNAEKEYTAAKKAYDEIKEKEGVSQPEKEEAFRKSEAARKGLNDAYNDILKSEKFTPAEKNWRRLQRNAKLSADYAGGVLKKAGRGLKEAVIQGIVMGTFFMVPSWGQQALESYYQKKALYDTIAVPQYIGNVWMQIPDELINEDDPTNTVPLYMAIPTLSLDIVDALRKGVRASLGTDYEKADFFVTSGDYGFGKYSLPSSPTSQMTHLNTGYDFYGDGSAVNKLVPMEQLLGQPGAQTRAKSLAQNMSELAGKVQEGGIGKAAGTAFYFGAYKRTYQKPSPAIATVLSSRSLDEAPKLLVPTLAALQGEFQAGTLRLQAIEGLQDDKQARAALTATAADLAPALPYHAYNLFIYQTASTQLAKVARAAASAGVAPYIYDYVIALDRLGRYIPALIPITSRSIDQMSVVPAYGPNPAAASVVSLLDNTVTGIDGKPQGTSDWTKLIKSDQIEAFTKLQPQVSYMAKLVTTQSAKGPFPIGSYMLSIPSELQNVYGKGVWIYEVHNADNLLEGSTAGKYADYLVPLDNKFALVQLPSGAVTYFLSLVSSRVFTNNLVPATEPVAFDVVQYGNNASTLQLSDVPVWQQQAATDKVPFAILFAGKTPRYSMYMDYDLNPYNLQIKKTIPTDVKALGGSLGLANVGFIPMRPQYAWTKLQMFLTEDQRRLSPREYLQDKAPEFVAHVQAAYQQWRRSVTPLLGAISLVGPFNFTTKLLENVQLQATSLEDAQHGTFVYTSASLPHDYFVVATKASLDDPTLGAAFNVLDPQTYLVSLISGNVYMRDENDAVVPANDEYGAPLHLPVQKLLDVVQRNQRTSFLKPLLTTITTAQQRYREQVPAVQIFSRFNLYLDPQDEANKTYIYQDVTGVASQDRGNLAKATDFFIGAQLSDKKATNIGKPLTGDTQIIISLLNGAIYDRKGYTGTMGSGDQLNFVAPYDTLAPSLGVIRPALRAEIKKRVDQVVKAYQQERAALQQAQQKERPSLDSNTLAQIKSNDYLAAPYETLKKVGNRYYGATSLQPDSSTVDGIVDYATGTIYDGDGKALITYRGLLLDDTRRAVGIAVDVAGNEHLGVPNTGMKLPVVAHDGASAFMPAAQVQPGIPPSVTVGTDRYDILFNTVIAAFIAKVTPAQGTPYYLDLYGGYMFNLDGTPVHSKAHIATAAGVAAPLFVGESAQGAHWFLVPQGDVYQQYVFKTMMTTAEGEGQLAENSYLAETILVYQTRSGNTITYKVLKQAGVDKQGNAQFIPYQTYTHTGEADVLTYLRSGKASGSPDYGTVPTTYDAAQDSPLLVIRAQGMPQKVLARKGADSFDMVLFDASNQQARKGTETESTLSKTIEGTTYTLDFIDRRIDNATGGMYASTSDATTLTYYSYDDRPLLIDKLKALLDQLKLYVITDVTGTPQLVRPLSLNFKTVTTIESVPDVARDATTRMLQTGNVKYDPITNRYVYQLGPADQAKSYYRDGVSYVDLLSGVLYFSDGKPALLPLLPSQLVQLQDDKHIAVPVDEKGNPKVGAGGRPYVVYR